MNYTKLIIIFVARHRTTSHLFPFKLELFFLSYPQKLFLLQKLSPYLFDLFDLFGSSVQNLSCASLLSGDKLLPAEVMAFHHLIPVWSTLTPRASCTLAKQATHSSQTHLALAPPLVSLLQPLLCRSINLSSS